MKFSSRLLILFIIPLAAQSQSKVYSSTDGIQFRVETILEKLEIPWSLVFDGEGNLYFTERPGRLQVLRKNETSARLVAMVNEVVPTGEGGLMGLAFHPQFSTNRFVYLSYTCKVDGDLANKVVRYRLVGDKLSDATDIVHKLPASSVHNGCRIKFGPDGKLYVTTGEAAERDMAQEKKWLGGKILRLNDDGSVPSDNPYSDSPVYAIGVRNPQGIDWHPSGLLFETEHGPSGFDGPGGGDEVNIIEAGKNYGWPVIHHKARLKGMESPLLEYTPALAPASGMFYKGAAFPKFRNNFFFGCLRGERIQRVVLDEANPRKVLREEALLQDEFKRIRDVVEAPDGSIYFSTSNRDGRARPFENDDRIMRIVPVKE